MTFSSPCLKLPSNSSLPSGLSKIQLRLGLLQEPFFDPTTLVHISHSVVIICVHIFSILDGRFPKVSFPVLSLWHLSQHLILNRCLVYVCWENQLTKAVLISLAKTLSLFQNLWAASVLAMVLNPSVLRRKNKETRVWWKQYTFIQITSKQTVFAEHKEGRDSGGIKFQSCLCCEYSAQDTKPCWVSIFLICQMWIWPSRVTRLF